MYLPVAVTMLLGQADEGFDNRRMRHIAHTA